MRRPGPLGSCSPVCPLGVLCRICGVLGHLAPVHRCARSVRCFACAVSWATWLLLTGVPAWFVVLRVRRLGPLGSCSPVCPRGLLCCICRVSGHLAPVHRCARSARCFARALSWATWLPFTVVPARCVVLPVRVPGHLAPVQRCARSVCCFAYAVSSATWLLFTGVPARGNALRVRCPGPLGSCSPVCPPGFLCCVCGVLGHLAPVHRCARVICCVACAASWATWLLFTAVPARCVVLLVRRQGPLGSRSPVWPLRVLCRVCRLLGHLAPVHRCARVVCCVASAVSSATWLLFTCAPAPRVALVVRCPGPLGSRSPLCPHGVLCCVWGVLGHLAPLHRCTRSVRCFARAVSSASCLLFTGVHARCVVLRVRCPALLGSCSPVCPLGVLLCVCGVLSHLLLSTGVPARCVALRLRCPGPSGSCAASGATWLLFTGAPAPSVALLVRCPRPLASCSPVCMLSVLCCVCGVLGHLAPVHRCARSVCCVAYAVSSATWLLFTGVPARSVALRMRCPGPLGSSSPVHPLCPLLCWCGVLGLLPPVHRRACSVCCVVCAVSWATWLLCTAVPARCVVLRMRCPRPLGCCSPVCPLGVLLCVCGVLSHLAPVHRCARSVRCFAYAVSWATWLLFSAVPAWFAVLHLRRPGPLGSCSPVCLLRALLCSCAVMGHLAPVHRCARTVCCVACACPGPLGSCSTVCPLGVLLCVCGVLGHLAPVHRCARSAQCFVCAVSWATWLLFTGVPAWFFVLRLRCPGPLGSCSPLCPLSALCCLCGVKGRLAPVHRCARSVCCVKCAVSWATWLLFTGVPAWFVVLHLRCLRPLGSCSPVCPRGLLCRICGVFGHLAPVHLCARSARCFGRAVSRATWLPFTVVPAWCVVLHLRCRGPLGSSSPVYPPSVALLLRCPRPLASCSPVCMLGVLCCVCGVLGHLAPVHRCARFVRCLGVCVVLGHLAPVHRCARVVFCVASAVSWATWLLFTAVPAQCVVLLVRRQGPLGSRSPVCPLRVLCRVCRLLGHLAPVHRCARAVCCVASAVSSATWLLFSGVAAPRVALLVRCLRPLGSCSLPCPLGVLCCVCGVLGHLAPVHQCARSVLCFACAVSWANRLPFTGLPARCVVLRVRCPGPLGSCSPVCQLCVLCCACCVLGHLGPVHRCARSVCCVACTVSLAFWLLFTGVLARCRVSGVRCPGPLGSCSGVCSLDVLCCGFAVRGIAVGCSLIHPDGGCS